MHGFVFTVRCKKGANKAMSLFIENLITDPSEITYHSHAKHAVAPPFEKYYVYRYAIYR